MNYLIATSMKQKNIDVYKLMLYKLNKQISDSNDKISQLKRHMDESNDDFAERLEA